MKKTIIFIILILWILPSLLAGGCRDTSFDTEVSLIFPPRKVTLRTHRELSRFLENLGYDRQSIAKLGVPNFILTQLPEDMHQIAQPRAKKQLFFLSILPMALMINEEITAQRRSLLDILAKLGNDQPLSKRDIEELRHLAVSYKIKGDPISDLSARNKLLTRVDIVPPSLILAQAANESAYGTSRFAQMANNLFGEWTYTPGAGLVPEDRPDGEYYEVRLFPDILASMKSYVKNINTHWAYRDLRALRRQHRLNGEELTGVALATGLELYSERRLDYVGEIIRIIRYNRLHQFNQASLRSTPVHQLYRRTKPTLMAMAFQ